jgi:phage/plasmid primase-like uncharacterized protein
MTSTDSFRAAMRERGIAYDGFIAPDGKLHRFKAEGDSDASSWYVLHDDGKFMAGAFGCWRRSLNEKWNSANGDQLTADEKRLMSQRWREADNARKTDEEKRQTEAKIRASTMLSAAAAVVAHPYLERKRVGVHGEIRCNDQGCLLLALRDAQAVLHSLQFIAPDKRFHDGRDKDFLPGGKVQGCFYEISDNPAGPLIICEGYATGASIHEATGWATVCAMSCGNLGPVATALRKKFPGRTLVIASDNDRFTDKNPGVLKATEAAKAAGAHLAVPDFADEDTLSTDFNDLARLAGPEAVARVITKAIPVFATPLGELQLPPDEDPTELLKHRFLCQRMSLLIIGPTGKGKSSLLLQALICWSLGKEFFGIKPTRCLSSIYVQAENDDGDIASMRDGIATGLGLSEEERRQAFARVLVFTETCLTGKRFCEEVLRKLLQNHHPDLLAIDPALSYLGADTKEQRDVGAFLRTYLNPLLFDFNCAGIINHHTNKIGAGSGSADDSEQRDFAYYGSGSAEWANWARAILALEPTRTKGVYRMHAGKRGQKLHWTQPGTDPENPVPRYAAVIAHSRDPKIIHWRQADPYEVDEVALSKSGRRSKIDPIKVADLLSEKSLPYKDWSKLAMETYDISFATFKRAKAALGEKVLRSKTNGNWCLVSDRQDDLPPSQP